MRLVPRRDLPLDRGHFRLRVFGLTFALFFVVTMILAAARG